MVQFEQKSNSELLKLIKKDNTEAFRLLYDRHWKELYIKACKRVGEEEAKDIVQEIMTTLWRRRKNISIQTETNVAGYLYTALKYRIISHYAYTASEIRKISFFDVPEGFDNVTGRLEFAELRELIEREVSKLPFRMQQIFRMSREDDYSISDIASHLHLSEQTVKNQLTEALKRLRLSIHSKTTVDFTLVLMLVLISVVN